MEGQGIHFLHLPRNVHYEILSYLGYKQLSRLGACCRELRELCNDDILWKNICRDCWDENYTINNGTWKEAFKNEFKDKRNYMPSYKTVRNAWNTIKSVINRFDPHIVSSLNPGITETDLDRLEEIYRVKIPNDIRCIYRFHDGQIPRRKNGLFGNVKVYEYSRTEYFFPLTIERLSLGVPALVIAGYEYTRIHCLLEDRPPFKAGNLITNSAPKANSYLILANTFLEYFLDYAQKLETNYFPIIGNKIYRFYKDPSWVAKSFGVNIDVSTAFVHELERDLYVFAYLIRFTMDKDLPEEMSCQLESRHWAIREDREVHTVEGKGVVGLNPVFSPGSVFTYTSCVKSEVPLPSMKGHFVVRNLTTGELYELAVPEFHMDAGSIVTLRDEDDDD